MKITKIFDITLNIDNINDIFTKDINQKLLSLIKKKYQYKCYLSSYVLKINKIINRSLLEFNQNDLNCSFHISIQFEAECLVFNKNEVILNMKIQEIVNNNLILKNTTTSEINEIIIALIKNNQDLSIFSKDDIIPIIVGKVKYSLGSDKITINAYPFIPIISNIIYYQVTGLNKQQLELLQETILPYIEYEEQIKNDLLKTKNNTWDYFKNLVYPYTNTNNIKSKPNMINLMEVINNSDKYNNKIIAFDEQYDISNCELCIYDDHNSYVKINSYMSFYELCKKYYLYLKLINDLSINYNSEKEIKSNTKIFDIYNKYKK
jgi:hypothetical protein